MIIRFSSFILLMGCITFIYLCMLNHPCIPGMNPTWLWCMIFLMCCWIWLASILGWGWFWHYNHQWYWLVVSFLVVSLSTSGIRVILPCEMNFGVLFKGLEELKDWYKFLKCLVDFASKTFWFWVFLFWEVFDYWLNVLTHDHCVLVFYSWFNTGRLYFLGIFHFFQIIQFVGV